MLVRYTRKHPLLWLDSSEVSVNDLDENDSKLRELIIEIRGARSKQRKLKALLEKYENEYGPQAEKRVLEIIAEDTKNAWVGVAKKVEKNNIQGILDTLWSSFEQIGGEFTVERTEDSAQIHCTKCPMADTYLKIGKPELGLIFHCSTDPHIVAGFNPKMKFRITKRLMNGDSCCDHYYSLR